VTGRGRIGVVATKRRRAEDERDLPTLRRAIREGVAPVLARLPDGRRPTEEQASAAVAIALAIEGMLAEGAEPAHWERLAQGFQAAAGQATESARAARYLEAWRRAVERVSAGVDRDTEARVLAFSMTFCDPAFARHEAASLEKRVRAELSDASAYRGGGAGNVGADMKAAEFAVHYEAFGFTSRDNFATTKRALAERARRATKSGPGGT